MRAIYSLAMGFRGKCMCVYVLLINSESIHSILMKPGKLAKRIYIEDKVVRKKRQIGSLGREGEMGDSEEERGRRNDREEKVRSTILQK